MIFDADALYGYRKRAGYTQEKLSHLLDVTLRTVQRWESGEAQPHSSKILLLAATLRRQPDDFYRDLEQDTGRAA